VFSVSGLISFDAVDREFSDWSPICDQDVPGEYRSLPHVGDVWKSYGQSLEQVYKPERDMLDVLRNLDGFAPSTADFSKLDVEKIGSFVALLLKQVCTAQSLYCSFARCGCDCWLPAVRSVELGLRSPTDLFLTIFAIPSEY
jgi:hypothetical protein